MPFPTIIYNASTGSNTAASGAGPGTALTGAAATNGAGAVVNLDGSPDLTNVATDGSHALWLNIAGANRNLFKITAKDAGAFTVTCEDTPASLGAGQSWAIGGKRLHFNNNTSKRDWADFKAGWTSELEAGTYDTPVVIAPVAGTVGDGPVTFRNASGASPIVRTTANVGHFDLNIMNRLRGLTATTNSGTKTTTYFAKSANNGAGFDISNCIVDDLFNGLQSFWNSFGVVRNTVLKNLEGSGFITTSLLPSGVLFEGCEFIDGAAWGVDSIGEYTLHRCIVHNNASGGVRAAATGSGMNTFCVSSCVIDGNGNTGISLPVSSPTNQWRAYLQNNIISNHAVYGIDAGADIAKHLIQGDYNFFYNNTAHRNNIAAGANDVELTADPYTNLAGDDFSLNSTAGGGAAVRTAGWPGAFPGGTTTGYLDGGAAQHQDAGGGGGNRGSLLRGKVG